jgi:hypothetical protein
METSFYYLKYIYQAKKIIIGSLSDVGHIYHPSRTKRMDHIYEEIIAGSCKKMKFVLHIDRCCTAPTPCKRNVNMLHTPCRHGRRVISPCQSLTGFHGNFYIYLTISENDVFFVRIGF